MSEYRVWRYGTGERPAGARVLPGFDHEDAVSDFHMEDDEPSDDEVFFVQSVDGPDRKVRVMRSEMRLERAVTAREMSKATLRVRCSGCGRRALDETAALAEGKCRRCNFREWLGEQS